MRRLVLIFLSVFLLPLAAHAQCNMPHGAPDAEMGVIVFNKDHKVMQYCNGDDWIGLWGGGGGGVQRISGEIVAFDLGACPDGWSEYLPARGRFLRGIDNGAGNDPSGTRATGHLQADAFQGHHHNVYDNYGGSTNGPYWHALSSSVGAGYTRNTTQYEWGWKAKEAVTDGVNGSPRIANETRPKNVAVLYCRKN